MDPRIAIKPLIIVIALALTAMFSVKLIVPATRWGSAKLSSGLGLKSITLASDESGPVLNVRLTAPPQCMNGDFFLIQRELSIAPRSRLLLTLEPIIPSESKIAPQLRELTLSELMAGVEHKFTLPKSESEPHDLGVFLCLDQNRIDSCAVKNVYNITELLTKYVNGGGQTVALVRDKPYYFQYVRQSGDQISFTQKLSDQLDASDLHGFVRGSDILDYGKHRRVADRISELYSNLGSLPLSEGDGSLVITLPRMDSQVCEEILRRTKEEHDARQAP